MGCKEVYMRYLVHIEASKRLSFPMRCVFQRLGLCCSL